MKNRVGTLAIAATLAILAGHAAHAIEGRYVTYGNPLSPYLGLAEFEVWSGGSNVVSRRKEMFTQDYLYKPYRWSTWELVDGKKDTEGRHVEFGAAGTSTYSDTALGYTAFEVDLGQTMPIEKIDIYRSRYKMKGYQDLGWRYLLVLDDDRKIVAWQTFNVYQAPHPGNKGIWSIVPQPAEGVPAGKVVPHRSRSWLSEAEFLRDFLGKPVVDQVTQLSDEDKARLERFEHRNDPAAIAKLGENFFRIVELERPGLEKVKALVEQEKYAEARKLNDGRTTQVEAADRLAIRELEGADWQEYAGTFEITDDTLVRARTFREGVETVPCLRTAGDDVSMISYGFFAKRATKPALIASSAGLS